MDAVRTKVTVGVCGGIAAYKSVELVRLLQDAGYDPHVVMTKSAEEFVRPLTFAAISGHKVITTLWGEEAGTGSEDDGSGEHSSVEHIQAAQSTKLLVVAPATANMLAKFAHGLADDFLSTMFSGDDGSGDCGSGDECEDVGASGDAGECGDAAGAWGEGDRAGEWVSGLWDGWGADGWQNRRRLRQWWRLLWLRVRLREAMFRRRE